METVYQVPFLFLPSAAPAVGAAPSPAPRRGRALRALHEAGGGLLSSGSSGRALGCCRGHWGKGATGSRGLGREAGPLAGSGVVWTVVPAGPQLDGSSCLLRSPGPPVPMASPPPSRPVRSRGLLLLLALLSLGGQTNPPSPSRRSSWPARPLPLSWAGSPRPSGRTRSSLALPPTRSAKGSLSVGRSAASAQAQPSRLFMGRCWPPSRSQWDRAPACPSRVVQARTRGGQGGQAWPRP